MSTIRRHAWMILTNAQLHVGVDKEVKFEYGVE
jgi:hypothetical protein